MPELIEKLQLPAVAERTTLHRAVGCTDCGGTGYRGRSSIVEILAMTDDIRHAVLKSADAGRLHALAVESGMQTMYEHGLDKALAGVTSIEEVLRVTRML